jgi:hypothetical protein
MFGGPVTSAVGMAGEADVGARRYIARDARRSAAPGRGGSMGQSGAVWSGWIVFAGVMMLLTGAFNALQGLAAIFSPEYLVRAEGTLLVADFTAWGWVMLAWGVIVAATGAALLAGQAWSRWAGVVVVGLNAIGHAAFMAFPVWNVLIIALCIVVIFALTARWDVAQADMRD